MSNKKSDLANIPASPKSPDRHQSAGKNKNIAYPLKNYIGDKYLRRAQDKEGFKKAVKDYEGIVLFITHIKLDNFKSMFDENFVVSVLKTSKIDNKISGVNYVTETVVYIPEISGCLPLPDMPVIDAFINDIKSQPQSQNLSSDRTSVESLQKEAQRLGKSLSTKRASDVKKQLRRLDRMPRFYCVDKYSGTPIANKKVKIKFPNENDYTKGILQEVYN